MIDLLEPLLKHPEAPLLLERFQDRMLLEQKQRRDFREWIDDAQKAEFINGEVIMHSPVKRRHWKVSGFLSTLLNVYVGVNHLGTVGVEKVMISLTRNDYEPDICFFNSEKSADFTEDQMLFPAPDFIIEILSKRTAKMDKTIKKQDYAAHGVKEYWIIDPIKQVVEQYLLLNSYDKEYFMPYTHYIVDDIKSKVIEGFEIPVAAIFEEKANLLALQALVKK
jgi:Uma2 family endonuclease